MGSIKHENKGVYRTSVAYAYLTGVAADTETITVGNRVYEFDTHATGAITAGNVRVDINASQDADASCTALVAAVNADTARKMDAVVMANNDATNAGVIFCGKHEDVGNLTIAETITNGVKSAAAATGYAARKDYAHFGGSYTVTTADATLLALSGGNEVPIGVVPTTTAPTITSVMVVDASGVYQVITGLVVKATQVNSNFYAVIVEDGSTILAATDVITWAAVI